VLRSGTPQLLVGEAAASVVSADVAGSALLVPLGAGDAARGVLVVTTRHGEPPVSASAVDELQAFAAQATLALELAERRRDAERLVVYEDRDRIARDLHDLVIQRLFATGMQLESAARLVDKPDAAARVRRAVSDLDTTIREIRSTIYALTAEQSGEPESLRSRFFEVVDAGTEQLGHTPAVRMTGLVDTSVPPTIAEHLLLVLREALSNAARHAGARRVEVVLEVGEQVSLTVRDDGRGLPGALHRRSGLAHLEDRAQAVGGRFSIGTAPEGGTELVWTAPLTAVD
jgi:signal transduction histidine kinase